MRITQLLVPVLLIFSAASHAEPVGTVVTEKVSLENISGRDVVDTIPIPEGKWLIIANLANRTSDSATAHDMRTVWLAQSENGKLIHMIVIRAKVSTGKTRWLDEPCKAEGVLFKDNYGTSMYQQKCLVIRSTRFLQSDDKMTAEALEVLSKANITNSANGIKSEFVRYDETGKLLIYMLYVFPDAYGFENPAMASMNLSPWHFTKISNDPKKVEFIEAVKKYDQYLVEKINMAYENPKADVKIDGFKFEQKTE